MRIRSTSYNDPHAPTGGPNNPLPMSFQNRLRRISTQQIQSYHAHPAQIIPLHPRASTWQYQQPQRTHQQDEHCPISERHNPPLSTCHPHSGVLTLHTQTEHRQSPQQGKFYGILLLLNPHWLWHGCSKHSQVFCGLQEGCYAPIRWRKVAPLGLILVSVRYPLTACPLFKRMVTVDRDTDSLSYRQT